MGQAAPLSPVLHLETKTAEIVFGFFVYFVLSQGLST